jgi:hypothetical protein
MILFRRHTIILCEDVQEYYQKITFIIFQFLKPVARLKLDLHDVYNNSKAIDQALREIFEEAIEKRIREVEIIPGKGSGQLRKKVERFLQQPHIKPLYHRIENDSKNFGRLFVYFRF